ncbi:MAG TPA: hypothetical protein VFX19_11790 [Dehalococcoidia bacterium]|jgi:hypothetical protein|nr:hypothetical protein [Dehalococcoidia bacterium]
MSRRQRNKPQVEDYDFFSFAPLFMFAVGAFVATFLTLMSGGYLTVVVWILSVFGTAWGLVHLLNTWRRRKSLQNRQTLAAEEERERRALAARNRTIDEKEESTVAARRRRRRRRSSTQ